MSIPKEVMPVDDLEKFFIWNKATGELRWARRTADMFRSDGHTAGHNAAAWNARHAGELASRLRPQGYLYCDVGAHRFAAHRIVWALHYGYWPDGQIDHINHIRNDNRLENLRHVTHAENTKNKRLLSNNTSGVCGVSWAKARNKWRANIKINGKVKVLGTFHNKADAIAVRKAAEIEYGFHPNHGMAA